MHGKHITKYKTFVSFELHLFTTGFKLYGPVYIKQLMVYT